MILRKLAGQTATYGMSTIIVKFINYLLTPYLTNILTESQYGVQSYYYSFIPFGLTLLTMGLETGYFRFVGKSETAEEKNRVFSTIFTTVSLTSLLFFIAVCLFTGPIYRFTADLGAGSISLIPIVGALIAIDAITAIPYAKLRAQERAKRFLATRVINVLVNVFFCVFFYSVLPLFKDSALLGWMWIEGYGAGYVFIANLIASITTLFMLLPQMEGVKLHIDRKLLKALLLFSAPLLISGISGTANEFIDRQLLAILLPTDIKMSSVGIYSGVMKVAALMYLFIQMYRFAAEPFFLSNVKKEDFKLANAEAMKYFIIVSVMIFLGITLYMDIFQYFIGAAFRVGLRIVPILLLSNMFIGIYVNLSFWYKVTEKTHFALIITLAGLAVTIILNFALIPLLGYEGSAWARLGCEGSMVLLSYFLNQKYYPIPYDLKTIFKYMGAGAVIYTISVVLPIEHTALRLLANTILFITFILFFIQQEKINLRSILKH